MPRYEIVAHVTRHLDCDTAEEAAAMVRSRLLADADDLLHLAVWREDSEPAVSPLPAAVRQRLIDFFEALERSAGEAEAAFRGRVEALLMAAPNRRHRAEESDGSA